MQFSWINENKYFCVAYFIGVGNIDLPYANITDVNESWREDTLTAAVGVIALWC